MDNEANDKILQDTEIQSEDDNLVEEQEGNVIERISLYKEKMTDKFNILLGKKYIIVLLIILFVLICSVFIVHTKWNVIMGFRSCKSGDYESAIKYYTQEINNDDATNISLKRSV